MPEDRWRWEGVCLSGHTDVIFLRFGETPEQIGLADCQWLLRNADTSWDGKGVCLRQVKWTRVHQVEKRPYRPHRVRVYP